MLITKRLFCKVGTSLYKLVSIWNCWYWFFLRYIHTSNITNHPVVSVNCVRQTVPVPFLSLVRAYIIVLAYCLILMIESKKGGIWPTFNLPSITKNRKELGHIYWLDTSVNSIFIGKLSVLWSKREDIKLYAINLINWNDAIW